MARQRKRVLVIASTRGAYMRRLFRGVVEYVRSHPNRLEVVLRDERFFSRLPGWQGHAIIAPLTTTRHFRLIQQRHLPTVNVSGRLSDTDIPMVIPNDPVMGRLAAEHLLERGLRHFVYYTRTGRSSFERRGQGFVNTLGAHGFDCEIYQRKPGTFRGRAVQTERKRMVQWITRLPKPVGMLCCSDADAWQLYEACDYAEVTIPDDVAVVSVDNDDFFCETQEPPLSSVECRPDAIGYQAAAIVADMLNGKKPPSKPVYIEPVGVVVRQSTDIVAAEDSAVATVVRYISEHSNEPLNVSALLTHVPLSRRALERRFERAMGRSILEEIHRVKIEKIKQLLVESDQSIDQIARACGFPYSTHMSTLFLRKTKMSPNQYRKKYTSPRSPR